MKITQLFKSTKDRRILFVSDLHYGHENIMHHCDRPFKTVDEMNSWILSELKEKIRPEDTLFDLGDMFWNMTREDSLKVLDQIPTKNIYKILGNHDKYGLYFGDKRFNIGDRFKLVGDIFDIRVESWKTGNIYQLSLCHYPMLSWNHKARGSFMIHGHTHGNIDEYNDSSTDLRIDISVDSKISHNLGSFVIDFEDILEAMKNKAGGIEFSDWVKREGTNL